MIRLRGMQRMDTMRKSWFVVLALGLLAGVGPLMAQSKTPTLVGTTWEWVSTTTPDEALIISDPARYQVTFMDDGTVAARVDCNRAFGRYTANGASLRIELAGTTMALCADDSQGEIFAQQLAGVTGFSFDDGALVMEQTPDGGAMRFRAEGNGPAAEASALWGTVWRWVERGVGGASEAITPSDAYTVTFNADGSVNIQADCNIAFGAYSAESGALSIEVTGVTRALCPPGSRSQEFLDLLDAVSAFRFTPEGQLMLAQPGDSGTLTLQAGPPSLVGPTWEWVQTVTPVEVIAAAEPARYTTTFHEDGTYSWTLDCNSGGGNYTLDGSRLSLGPGVSTLMACPEGSQDFQFQQIANATSYFFLDGELYVELSMDSGTMQLRPQPPSLTGAAWQWVRTVTPDGTITAAEPARYTLQFSEDGSTYLVTADCNSGSGGYSVEGSRLTLDLPVLTLMACPEGSQDRLFLEQLTSSAIFFFQGGSLYLDRASGDGTMQFSPVP